MPVNDEEDNLAAKGQYYQTSNPQCCLLTRFLADGLHWSLLLVSTHEETGLATHFDSIPGYIGNRAQRICERMRSLLDRPFEYIEMLDTLRQTDYVECGVIVCLTTETLLSRLLLVDKDQVLRINMKDERWNPAEMRSALLKILNDLKTEAEEV